MRNDIVLSPWGIKHTSLTIADDFCESVFFSGNGRFGVRGYLPFEKGMRSIQKGLFMAGIFGEIKPGITDFVNLPTPVFDKLYIDGQEAELSSPVTRYLDLRRGLFTAKYSVGGAEIEYSRFMPLERPSLLAQRIIIKPVVPAELVSGIETVSCNCPIPDDQTKDSIETFQLAPLKAVEFANNSLVCRFQTVGTSIDITEQVSFQRDGTPVKSGEYAALRFNINGETVIDKLAVISSSRDVDPRLEKMPEKWNYDELLSEHEAAWMKKWSKCDFPIDDAELQTALRYSVFQLIVSCSRLDPTVSIGARGLTHARYKGCYFWDTDMFMLPFFLENDPDAARNLCEYRIRALPAAKAHAKKMNNAGARYPWMASFDGSEQCETWDIGCSEVHITADVAYAIDKYCKTTDDRAFYLDHAAELYIETARFWVSRYSFDRKNGKADLLWCKGPDEYCGVSINNLYTNVMAQHNLTLAIKAANDLKRERHDKYSELGITDEEICDWEFLCSCIVWPHDPDTGRLTTDELFHRLESVDITAVKKSSAASYHDVCFDRLQRYKLVKQADVLLLMTRLPELFSREEKLAAWNDFEPICLHDSTLSFASHALFALENGLGEAGMTYLRKALLLDLRDVMGNTGKEGLHLACMGEAWQAALRIKCL